MKRYTIILLILLNLFIAHSQVQVVIKGSITDSLSSEPLIGAAVIIDDGPGTISDTNGKYQITTTGYQVHLICRYVGYQSERRTIHIVDRDTILLDFIMKPSFTVLDEIVVSASRYKQSLSDVMVSMNIIKPQRIRNNNTTSLEEIIGQTPGVEILDGQPSIRGGSGYSYGAGSRVLVLVDDLPILSGDAGDVKWDYLPVENIAQIEIIKGASSVLYGSSALNGVINIRTDYPTIKPETRLTSYMGFYMDPGRKEMIWWDTQPMWTGVQFLHSRKIRQLDLVVGANMFHDQGYRENENQLRIRQNLKLNYRSPKIKGLSYGLNLNGMLVEKTDFLMWQDADSGAYVQNPDAVSALTGSRFNMDPYLVFNGSNGSQHSLKTRYFHIKNNFSDNSDKNSQSDLVFGEYKYYRKFGERVDFTSGISGSWTGTIASLYGNHTSFNNAVYLQLDARPVNKLKASLGVRFERYKLDKQVEYSSPVVRTGLNFQVFDHTYMRVSLGQGYRFPSIAEKFTATSVSAMNIFPNPELESESGWSTEIGIKQGIKLNEWNGYIDLAVFRTRYREMIEFNFGLYAPDSVVIPTFDHIGFKALNVGNARITGFESTVMGEGKIFFIQARLTAGYTYIVPVDLNTEGSDDPDQSNYLKYRYRHSLKADIELEYQRFTFGYTLISNSRMENIDEVFLDPLFGELILPGFPAYWNSNNKGYVVMNARLLYDITEIINLGLIAKNLLNKEYMGRPGDIRPPRNIAIQLSFNF
ncbi:MAG TPA: TonB-dependent receptor [Bacteroides sp.]|nr:TonB-dependent receptor [Bacteroides sp.]